MTAVPRYRTHEGPVILSAGFRPFFLGSAVWAAISVPLWLCAYTGGLVVPTALPPLIWHAHEMIFGFAAATVAGFLLTAIPNWTGRFPLQGKPLLTLFALWLAGRVAMLATDKIGSGVAAIVDCSYLIVLTVVVTREIIAGNNWRNLRVAVLIGLTAVANIVFQAEVLIYAAPTYGLRLAVAAIVGLIMVVGGRITPSFTSNWLTRQGSEKRPAPLDRFDIGSIALAALALIVWIAAPDWSVAA